MFINSISEESNKKISALSDDGGGTTASQLLLMFTKGIVRLISSRKYILGFDEPFNMLVMAIRCF